LTLSSNTRFELEHSRLLADADILLIDLFDLSINRTTILFLFNYRICLLMKKNAAPFSITKENYSNKRVFEATLSCQVIYFYFNTKTFE
jgi:hypothetical protein